MIVTPQRATRLAIKVVTRAASRSHIQASPAATNGPVAMMIATFDTVVRADFQHLRRWRKSVEQAQSYTFKAVITIIVTGFVGAVWLGVKVMLGK
jgi:ABC-type transporter Mla maintaining outer membrane lipid asymmetry permease subunit MlaE